MCGVILVCLVMKIGGGTGRRERRGGGEEEGRDVPQDVEGKRGRV